MERVDRLRRIITPMPAANRFRKRDDVEKFAAINAEAELARAWAQLAFLVPEGSKP